MKVLALIESPNHVCYRYRISAFAWALREQGFLLEVAPIERNTYRRLRQLRKTRDADVVILQRKLLPLWQLRLLRRSARKLIYDVDDALFQRDSYSAKGADSWTRLAHFWSTVRAADAVLAGNGFLCKRIASYIGPDRAHLMPTCLEPAFYTLAAHRGRAKEIRLAWIGQQSTLPSLYRAKQHLAAASARTAGLELRIISDCSIEGMGMRVVPRQWSSSTEATELAACDIGINWLPDDTWSRGKCGLKVLQYMAAGLPVVANPVGMNCEMIEHGHTGFLASTPSEWSEAITQLADNPSLRRQMGAAARRFVEKHFSVGHWATSFAQHVADVAGIDRQLSSTSEPRYLRPSAVVSSASYRGDPQ